MTITSAGAEIGSALFATEPPEARGLMRDEVRLLVARSRGIEHLRFRELGQVLSPGDLLVVNTSATLAAAVDAASPDGTSVVVHFSTPLDDGDWAVELRTPDEAHPVLYASPGGRFRLSGGATMTLSRPLQEAGHRGGVRLWQAALEVPGQVESYLAKHGRPISYGHLQARWPLSFYQTIFAREAGSAEMPSAGRPFSFQLVAGMAAGGIKFSQVVLHTGVSSLESGEAPQPERFSVPAHTARMVNRTHDQGGRVIAVGTTVVRALESAATGWGEVTAQSGWTNLVLGPDRPAITVDAMITGWHETGSSHLDLLEAMAGKPMVERAQEAALANGYLWHEFGDSALLLPEHITRRRT